MSAGVGWGSLLTVGSVSRVLGDALRPCPSAERVNKTAGRGCTTAASLLTLLEFNWMLLKLGIADHTFVWKCVKNEREVVMV